MLGISGSSFMNSISRMRPRPSALIIGPVAMMCLENGFDVIAQIKFIQIQNGDVLTKVEVFVEIVALVNVELVNLVHHIFLLPW